VQPDFSKIPLQDIHLPPPVSWWPPAVGWWLLLFTIFTVVVLAVWQVKRYRRFKLRRIALKELNALYKNYQNNYDGKRFARDLSVLLRRISISYFPQGQAAGLAGKAWLAYLDSLLSAKHNKSGYKFSDGVGAILISAPYQNTLNDTAVNADALYRLSLEWVHSLGPVKNHSVLPATNIGTAVISESPRQGSGIRKEAAHVSV